MFKTITEENGEVSLIYYIPNVLTQTEQNDIKVWLDNNPNFYKRYIACNRFECVARQKKN